MSKIAANMERIKYSINFRSQHYTFSERYSLNKFATIIISKIVDRKSTISADIQLEKP